MDNVVFIQTAIDNSILYNVVKILLNWWAYAYNLIKMPFIILQLLQPNNIRLGNAVILDYVLKDNYIILL